MATTIVNGNDIGLYVGGVLIGCLTSSTFNSANEEIDVTCKDNGGAKQVLAGGNTSSIDFEGFFNPAATYGFNDLIAIHKNKTEVNIKMGDNTNLTVFALAQLLTINWTAPLNAGSTFSGTFAISGAWTYSET
jgi:predicted secreted protein